MRRSTLGTGAALVSVGVLAGVLWFTSGTIGTPALGALAAPEGSTAQPLGEIGPGACWPADERPSGGKAAGFATKNGTKDAADWLRKPENKKAALRLESQFNTHAEYYLVNTVVPDWGSLDQVERVARYVSLTVPVKMRTQIYVQNTYCQGDNVVLWKVQVLPVDEWISFVPGHEPGTADPRPVQKLVCGNPLLPPGKEPEKPATPVAPPGDCKEACAPPPSTPPTNPGCTQPCGGNEPKKPEQGSDPQGNAPVGGGVKDQPGPDAPAAHAEPRNSSHQPRPADAGGPAARLSSYAEPAPTRGNLAEPALGRPQRR